MISISPALGVLPRATSSCKPAPPVPTQVLARPTCASGAAPALQGVADAGAAGSMPGMGMPELQANMTVLEAPQQAGIPGTLRFRITDQLGMPITQYDVDREAYMHLLSVDMQSGRPLRDFQHVHPSYVGNGEWRLANFVMPEGGMEHIVGSFQSGGRMAGAQASVNVAGTGAPLPDTSGGYRAQLIGKDSNASGSLAQVQLTGPDGKLVTQLGTYLGATAHLSLFQPGADPRQLAFEHGHAQSTINNGLLSIDVENLKPGAYQAWLQFQTPGVSGQLHTVPIDLQW